MFATVHIDGTMHTLIDLPHLSEVLEEGTDYQIAVFNTFNEAIQSVSYQNALDMDWVTPQALAAYNAVLALGGDHNISAKAMRGLHYDLITAYPWLGGREAVELISE